MASEDPRLAYVVALDGTAGSGKSSTARAVAARLGWRHLDSGAFYRALAWALRRHRGGLDDLASLCETDLDALGLEALPAPTGFRLRLAGADLDEAELRSSDVTACVSDVAAQPVVRRWLLPRFRRLRAYGPLVAEGRDMGTVVFPDATLKVFLVADPDQRARRRLLERGEPLTPERLAAERAALEDRDRRDASRADAPLRAADDARWLDTSHLSFEEQVERIVAWVQERLDIDNTVGRG